MWRTISALAASWLVILPPAAAAFDVIQLTNNSIDDHAADISGSNAVWYGAGDIYPSISGSKVVWNGRDGDYPIDYEIYMTTITGPTPVPSISFGGLALLAGLVLGTAGRLIWRRSFASV